MILHLGEDCFVPLSDVVFIAPYDGALKNKDTRAFLRGLNKTRVSGGSRPRSAVVVQEGKAFTAYLSPISAATLYKRGATGGLKLEE